MRLNLVFWAAAAAYLLAALISKLAYPDLLPPPDAGPLAYALIFLVFVLFGHRFGRRLKDEHKTRLYLGVILLVLGALGWWGLLSAVAIVAITLLIIHYEAGVVARNPQNARKELRIVLLAVVLGLFIIPLAAGSIPILKPQERYSTFRLLYLAAGYFAVALISVKPDFRVFLLGELIAVVSTFRTIGLAVAIAYLLKLFQVGALSGGTKGRRYAVVGIILLGLLGVFAARYYITIQSYPGWKLGFLETLLYRPGVTYTVYERLFEMGMPLGKHGILFSTDPKGYVGSLFGRNVGYTYTIFGQPAYDFGILGLIEALFLGMALRDAERRKPTAVLAITFMTLMVPIGIDAFFLSAMAFFAYLSVEVDVWKRGH
ncbi:hypothetical protein A3L11_05365 [Thermococcus siculi]|uniref:Oligosaccharide repeat unit polymerase n=1 Tax=Thermococcus siculi TaxID=72803 RepID=A0A2Z2MM23_9EURY|nr:hypothetical protein [Thermococcus siculi]ASJ08685.1 hypothetical protein A3L11_05365 [Thermococcus siculi]